MYSPACSTQIFAFRAECAYVRNDNGKTDFPCDICGDTAFDRFGALSAKREKELQQRLSDICIVSRAKRLLMEREQMSESEAYLYIKNQAMHRHQAKRVIAQTILHRYQI